MFVVYLMTFADQHNFTCMYKRSRIDYADADIPQAVMDVISMFADSKLRLKSNPKVSGVISGTAPRPPGGACRCDSADKWQIDFCIWLLNSIPCQCNRLVPALKHMNLLLGDQMADFPICTDMTQLFLPTFIELSLYYGSEQCRNQIVDYIKQLLQSRDPHIHEIKHSLCTVIDQLRFDGHCLKTDDIMCEIINVEFIRICIQFNTLLALYYSCYAINANLVILDVEMAEILQEIYLQLENFDNVIGIQIYCQKMFHRSTNLTIKARYCDALGLVSEAEDCRRIIRILNEHLDDSLPVNTTEQVLKYMYRQHESERETCRRSLSIFDSVEYSHFEPIISGIQKLGNNDTFDMGIQLDNCVVKEVQGLIQDSRTCSGIFAEQHLQKCLARLCIIDELRCYDLNHECKQFSDCSDVIQYELELYYALKRLCLTHRTNLRKDHKIEMLVHFYVKHAELCRASGERGIIIANDLLTQAELLESSLSCVAVERAKWLDCVGRKLEAIRELESSSACAKDYESMSLLVKWKYESAIVDNYQLLELYQTTTKEHARCERAHFELARFLDHTTGCTNPDSEIMTPRSVELTVKSYCESIVYRSESNMSSKKHVHSCLYQSLPRLLTLWFLSGRLTYLAGNGTASGQWSAIPLQTLSQHIEQLTTTIRSTIRSVPSYHILRICISQLTSRLCHPHPLVSSALLAILARILIDFPYQTLWRLISVSQSSYDRRQERCKRLFEIARKKSPDPVGITKAISDCLEIGAMFSELCERPIRGNVNVMSMRKHFPALLRRLGNSETRLLLPVASQLFMDNAINDNYRDRSNIFISSAEDKVTILHSLQKPKRITLRGSDGHLYQFLCKSKDDLRIDHRFLEVANIVNQYLPRLAGSESESIRLYAVTPLSELCGLIEWMPNHETLNSAMSYPENLLTSVRQIYPPANSSIQNKIEVFQKKILPRFLPCRLNVWFRDQFNHVSDWYLASIRFTFSVAAWSMLGYIVGLGDRHCDNIMVDQQSGRCVHVDFNCLFNKGETLPVPEIIPFRLTHNIINSLGPIGVEGHFRRSCEKVLSSVRDNRELLLNVLETFVFDPLVEWKRHSKMDEAKKSRRKSDVKGLSSIIGGRSEQHDDIEGSGEIFNSMAQSQIERIKKRLNGCADEDVSAGVNRSVKALSVQLESRSLSVEGHVDLLINHTSSKRLLYVFNIKSQTRSGSRLDCRVDRSKDILRSGSTVLEHDLEFILNE